MMNLRDFSGAVVVIASLAVPILAQVEPRAESRGEPSPSLDPRSIEVLHYACGNEDGYRDVTLFGNGTLRVREGPWDDQELFLEELSPEALNQILRVLRGVYSEADLDPIRTPLGDGVSVKGSDRCEVSLRLPRQQEPLKYTFSSYDIPPLRITRLIQIAEDLAEDARPTAPPERLPTGYEPVFGDILRSVDGELFKVLRPTADKTGLELEGLDQPVRIFVKLEDLREAFVALEKPGDWRWRQRQ